MVNNAYSAYKKQSITTMTPMEIVVKLYSETERQLNRAIYFIEQKDFESANHALVKSQDIINALRSVLDMDIPMSKNLDSLYDYFNREILRANMKKDTEIIRTLLPMIAELKDAFTQVASMTKEQMEAQERSNRAAR
ncbi:MAG: flagellar export chaperone FliS [Ruminiclostridium sp.]